MNKAFAIVFFIGAIFISKEIIELIPSWLQLWIHFKVFILLMVILALGFGCKHLIQEDNK